MFSRLPSPSTPSGDCGANQGIAGLLFTWVLLTIATVVVSLRLYIRLGLRRIGAWDDIMAVMSLVVGIIFASFFTKMTTSGMGKHVSCLSVESVVSMLEFSAISAALNVIGIGLVKITVCLTLLRLVDRDRKRICQLLWAFLIFIGVVHFVFALVYFLRCQPLAALWNPRVHGTCMSTHSTVVAVYFGCTIDIITILVCAAIPLFVIQTLNMNLRTKVMVYILMGFGLFTAGCAIAKAATLRNISMDDYTWTFTEPATWAAIQQLVGVIIASLPALRTLFTSFRENASEEPVPDSPSTVPFSWRSTTRPSTARPSTRGGASTIRKHSTRPSQSSTAIAVRAKMRSMPWYNRDSGEVTISADTFNASTVAVTERGMSWSNESYVEKGLVDKDQAEDSNKNFLETWTLPEIGDRRSGLFTIPYLHPLRHSGSSKRS